MSLIYNLYIFYCENFCWAINTFGYKGVLKLFNVAAVKTIDHFKCHK